MCSPLLDWFRAHRRDLPWREPAQRREPYRVLVAEMMLQQTRVDTVIPYYQRWLERFPDIASLAGASSDEVLRQWQGLGYYRRALRLHAAARQLVADHGGTLPASREALEMLPGIGRYTAAAVAALAFDADAIAVDGNVRRLAARLEGWETVPADAAIETALARRLACPPDPGAPLAEALIELGALVCTPRAPACQRCPLRAGCAAASAGEPEAFPRRRQRPAPPLRRRWAVVALDGAGVWLRQRRHDEMLPGLWGFVQCETPPEGARCLPSVRHAYSHFRLELVPALIVGDGPAFDGAEHHRWADLEALALSAVDRRVLERLRDLALAPAVS